MTTYDEDPTRRPKPESQHQDLTPRAKDQDQKNQDQRHCYAIQKRENPKERRRYAISLSKRIPQPQAEQAMCGLTVPCDNMERV